MILEESRAGLHAHLPVLPRSDIAQQDVLRLEQKVSEPGFYQREHELVNSVLQELEEAKRRAESLSARWEDLEKRAQIK